MAKSAFRTKIFRLLLLFAAVPAIALTLFGYYLVVQTPLTSEQSESPEVDRLTDYYNELLYSDIELATDRYLADSTLPLETLDFLLAFDADQVRALAAPDSLTDSVVGLIFQAARHRERGLVAAEQRHYQFVRRDLGQDRMLLAGFVHDTSFTAALEGIWRETASRSSRRELRASYILFVGGLFLTVTLLTIAAAYLFSARVSRNLAEPLTALSEASRRIAAGDFGQVVTPRGEGEIGTLIDNFNDMAQRLERATARLAQTERVAAWRQVARRFAHELKNPLQPILVSLYRIENQLSGSADRDQIRESLRAASEEVKHLTELAERFSSLAKLPTPKLEPVDLNQLIPSVVNLYKEDLQPYEFEQVLPQQPAVVRADSAYLREALHNLLRNAMDACNDNDSITVQLLIAGEQAEIIVSDTGAGMDRETLSSARLPYFTTKEKGSGLGLAIVEKTISELAGQLQVASRQGHGTTVTISLPLESG